MIANRDAVIEGIGQACRDKIVGIGRGIGMHDLQRKWCGEDVIFDFDEEGLWIIPPFKPEPVVADTTVTTETTQVAQPEVGQVDKPDRTTTTTPTTQISRITVKGNVSMENWSEIFRCFISPAARDMNLKKLRLGIDFEMDTQDGALMDESDPKVKAMEESARYLGLDFGKQ